MFDVQLATVLPQCRRQGLGDHHRAVTPARAPDADGEVGLAFLIVEWQQVPAKIPQAHKHARADIVPQHVLADVGEAIYTDVLKALSEYSQTRHTNPTLNTVSVLAKDQLGEMAETLVRLTSFKHQFSMDLRWFRLGTIYARGRKVH